LRIERLEIVPYALPFREPYVTARGRLERRELLLVRLVANGHEGLGEAAPMLLRGGQTLSQLIEDLERCRPPLEGKELSPDPADHLDACAAAGASRQALLAIELALFDWLGKDGGAPVWDMLGASSSSPVPCNATLSVGPPAQVAERARKWAKRGFTTFKLKVGLDRDIDQVDAVRRALGPGAHIRLDANGSWSETEAIEKLHRLEQYDIQLVEQPVATLEGMASVRDAVRIPIAADESVNCADDARRAAAIGACDVATVKLAKVGRLRTAFDIAAVLPVYLSSALDGPVGIAAAAHLAQVLPTTGFAGSLAQGLATGELFEDTIASVECELTDAALLPSDTPGLGVEIDERALARRRL
jgi:o-succinylbenzoate synthase